jgi:hypothetical protein
MPITIICPNLRCRAILQVPDKVRGKKVRCGKCHRNFIVPAPTAAPNAKPKSEPEEAK